MSIATTAMLLHGMSLHGQETAAERHALAKNHLQRLATEMTARCLDVVFGGRASLEVMGL
jgi:hypothetical protein